MSAFPSCSFYPRPSRFTDVIFRPPPPGLRDSSSHTLSKHTFSSRAHKTSITRRGWSTGATALLKYYTTDFHIYLFCLFFDGNTEYATGYYTDQEKKCLGIQPDLTQNAVGGNGGSGGHHLQSNGNTNSSTPSTLAYCEYTYSEPTTSGCGSAAKSGALTPVNGYVISFMSSSLT